MATVKDLKNQLAHLALRIDDVKRRPIYAQAQAIPELVTLQLGLLGDMVKVLDDLQNRGDS
jgi:hypothetical protein